MTATWRILEGDCRTMLRTLPERSVQTCVTSPPYFGLRDYGTGEWKGGDANCDHVAKPAILGASETTRPTAGPKRSGAQAAQRLDVQFANKCGKCGATRVDNQIGLEPTPDEFVAALVSVFREVRRVLRDDGTVWLNLGDSYAGSWGNQGRKAERGTQRPVNGDMLTPVLDGRYPDAGRNTGAIPAGADYKAKDLLGIPWMVAFALRQPYYAGKITDELDRVWLAAMIDAEGCIFIHRRREGQSNGQGYVRKADSFGSGLEVANTNLRVVERCMEITGRGSISRSDKDRRQPLYRWNLRTNECRDVLREVYPYLVAKEHEARIACGVPSSGERATAAWEALKILHGGGLTDVDFKAPESLHTPGWYLRSDIIWSKLNPMPESVTDRPTKAHEYLFLLSKGPRYWYDREAIREAPISDVADGRRGECSASTSARLSGGLAVGSATHMGVPDAGRNKRSVWTVATQPYPGAHFATFPAKLIEPCVLAGCPERACGVCGAPWTRIVESSDDDRECRDGAGTKAAAVGPTGAGRVLDSNGWNLPTKERRTLGWEPSCGHDAPTVRGIVLDPFAGAGTTGVVALRHSRSFVGVELNPEYVELARDRIIGDAPLLNSVAEAA